MYYQDTPVSSERIFYSVGRILPERQNQLSYEHDILAYIFIYKFTTYCKIIIIIYSLLGKQKNKYINKNNEEKIDIN